MSVHFPGEQLHLFPKILEKMCDLKEAKNNGPGPLYLNTVYQFDQVN